MIAIDSNVLVRIVTCDDRDQAYKAKALLQDNCNENNQAFVSAITLCEVVWILKTTYEYSKEYIISTINMLINSDLFFIEHHQEAWAALEDFKSFNADFPDYYIAYISKKYGAEKVYTFDKKAAKHPLFELIK